MLFLLNIDCDQFLIVNLVYLLIFIRRNATKYSMQEVSKFWSGVFLIGISVTVFQLFVLVPTVIKRLCFCYAELTSLVLGIKTHFLLKSACS